MQFKAILEASMVSTPVVFTYNSPMSPGLTMVVKNYIERKSLHLFTEVLDVKKKTCVFPVGADKSMEKAIRAVSMLWSIILKRKGIIKINKQVKKSPYNWILQHARVVKSPIAK